MKTNFMFGLVTFAVAERVEFLWNDKDQDWIWSKSEESLQTTKGSSRRLGCSSSFLETGMAHQHRPHQDRLTWTAPTSTAPTPPAPPPSLKKALSSYIDASDGKSEKDHLIKELQQWSENCNKVPPNFSKQDAKLKTALLLSTRRKHTSIAQALLATNAVDPNARYKEYDAANYLAIVITANHPSFKENFNAFLFPVHMETINVGFTPLHLAVAAADKDMVNTIVRGGADITAATAYGLTPFHLAVMTPGNQEIVGLLMRHDGADILTKDGSGWTVLNLALKCEQERGEQEWVNVRAMWEVLHGKWEEVEKELKAQLKSAFVGNIPDIVLGYLRPLQEDLKKKIEGDDARKRFEELLWCITTLQKESI